MLGNIVGYDKILLDEKILDQIEQLKIDSKYARQCLKFNKHKSETTAYFFFFEKAFAGNQENFFSLFSENGKEKKKRVFRIHLPQRANPPALFMLTQDKLDNLKILILASEVFINT